MMEERRKYCFNVFIIKVFQGPFQITSQIKLLLHKYECETTRLDREEKEY